MPPPLPGVPALADQDSRKRGFAQRTADHRASRSALQDQFGIIAEEMRKRGRMLREGSAVPMAVATGSSKRGPEDQGDLENARRTLPTQGSDQMEDVPIPLDLRRKKAEKRGPSDVEDLITSHLNSVDMTDAVEVNHLVMGKLEMEGRKTVQVTTGDYCATSMPLTVIEESTDYSWVQNESTRLLSEMLNCTDVGPLRDRLGEKLVQSLLGDRSLRGLGRNRSSRLWKFDGETPGFRRGLLDPRRGGIHLDEGDCDSARRILPSWRRFGRRAISRSSARRPWRS